MDDKIFMTTDPLCRDICLKKDTWDRHLQGRHNETDIYDIKATIENPRYIFQNMKPKEQGSQDLIIDPKRQDYINLVMVESKLYVIKTIVEFEKEGTGHVVTNYILRNPREIKTQGGVIYDSYKNKNSTGESNI